MMEIGAVKGEKRNVGLMRVAAVLGWFGVALVLFSCEKEGVLEGSGEKFTVDISLGDIAYKENETLTRSLDRVVAKDVVPLEDGLYMEARLEADPAAEMRAPESLNPGVKVRVVAYQGSTFKATEEYTVMSYGLSANGSGLQVEQGSYTFVAYSYNSTNSPAYSEPSITVAPSNDLLWGFVTRNVTPTNNYLTVTMDHCFAQIRVKATSTDLPGQPNITNMTGVTITPGNSAILTVQTGAVDLNGTATTQNVSWPGFNNKVVTSNPITVNTGTANPIYVNIGSATVSGYSAFSNLQAKFTKALTVKTSYTLVVDFRRMPWAYSNIVWTGSKLTFAETPAGNATIPMYSQGVRFKWGSLVAVNPRLDISENPYVAGQYPSGSVLFSPTGVYNYASFAAIPYVSNYTTAPFNNADKNEDDFATYNNNTGFNEGAGLGDICRYISSKGWVSGSWRMPTSAEQGVLLDRGIVEYGDMGHYVNDHLVPSGSNSYGSHDYGYFQMGDNWFGYKLGSTALAFPAAGNYSNIGRQFAYWSASSGIRDSGYEMAFLIRDFGYGAQVITFPRALDVSVRCIRAN
jgi:hypothetical protein